MRIIPNKYTKSEFIKFLEKYNVDDNIVKKFIELPESIKKNGNIFKLDVNVTWYDDENTYYEFELNYYSSELIEYLFSSKVFKDIELSINNLLCELLDGKFISKNNKRCK